MTTLAPFARHWSACVFCFCASPSALRDHVRDACLLERRPRARADPASPSGPTTSGPAAARRCRPSAVLLAGFASAAVTATLTAASATTDNITNFFTMVLLLVMCLDVRRGNLTVLRGAVQCPRRESAARAVRTRWTPPSSLVRTPTTSVRHMRSGRTHDPWSLSNLHCQETLSREPARSATSHGSASTDMSVSAAAPRTAAPSPNSEARTSQPDQADESTRSSSTLRTSSTSHGASGPKQPPSTTTSTSKRFTAEREPEAEVPAGLGEAPDHGLVASLGAPDELRGDAARTAAGADRDAGPARDRLRARRTSRDSRAEPHLHSGPVGSTVMWPNSPPKPWAPRKSSPSMKMPPPTPTSPNTQTKFSASRATPCQCSARAARFASFSARTARPGSRQPRRSRPRRGSPTSRGSAPGAAFPSAPRRCRAAQRRRLPGPARISATASSASVAIRPRRFEDGLRRRAPVVGVDTPLVADRAGQILDADGEVVDVDLEPDRDDPVAELERLRRPADAAGVLVLARLPEQVELDQLTDEARDGPPRQARLGRDARARARLAGGDLLQHDAEIRPPHGRLIGARIRLQGTLEAHASTCEMCGMPTVDSIKPSVGFCMAIAQM